MAAPASESARASAAPMPREPPVTSATWPFKSGVMVMVQSFWSGGAHYMRKDTTWRRASPVNVVQRISAPRPVEFLWPMLARSISDRQATRMRRLAGHDEVVHVLRRRELRQFECRIARRPFLDRQHTRGLLRRFAPAMVGPSEEPASR